VADREVMAATRKKFEGIAAKNALDAVTKLYREHFPTADDDAIALVASCWLRSAADRCSAKAGV